MGNDVNLFKPEIMTIDMISPWLSKYTLLIILLNFQNWREKIREERERK